MQSCAFTHEGGGTHINAHQKCTASETVTVDVTVLGRGKRAPMLLPIKFNAKLAFISFACDTMESRRSPSAADWPADCAASNCYGPACLQQRNGFRSPNRRQTDRPFCGLRDGKEIRSIVPDFARDI